MNELEEGDVILCPPHQPSLFKKFACWLTQSKFQHIAVIVDIEGTLCMCHFVHPNDSLYIGKRIANSDLVLDSLKVLQNHKRFKVYKGVFERHSTEFDRHACYNEQSSLHNTCLRVAINHHYDDNHIISYITKRSPPKYYHCFSYMSALLESITGKQFSKMPGTLERELDKLYDIHIIQIRSNQYKRI